ncbi:MAG: ABC transporter ATP-binding protein, partial [Desulfobacterales bacterium]|nr:ABC transporter ATP-binding protein [Desulfobacterales bacterium]
MKPILKAVHLSKNFGGLQALKAIDLEVYPQKIVGIIGPNGAGKTTLFNCLTGLYEPSGGQLYFQDQPIVPELSQHIYKSIRIASFVFGLISFFWIGFVLFYTYPQTVFKLELCLFVTFIFALRILVIKYLNHYEAWAWSLYFMFLFIDTYFTIRLFLVPIHVHALLIYIWILSFIICHGYVLTILISFETRKCFGFKMGVDRISKMGISRTFQNIRLFQNLSVIDNVKIGAHICMNSGFFSTMLRLDSHVQEEKNWEQTTLSYLRDVGLENQAFHLASSLSYGSQRLLEIARALASKPKLLLLDEPAAGMNPKESSNLISLIRK